MTRYQTLLSVYAHMDTIYAGLILVSLWVAGTAHLLDWLTVHHARILVSIFWGLVVIVYAAGMLYLGLNYSSL